MTTTQKRTKAIHAVAQTLEADCGSCGEPLVDPRNGSYMLTSDTQDPVLCGCGEYNWLPRKAHLFTVV